LILVDSSVWIDSFKGPITWPERKSRWPDIAAVEENRGGGVWAAGRLTDL